MRIVSGIRPSGQLTIANYLGMISQSISLQQDNECFYFIADLHAITTPYDPESFPQNILDVAAVYLSFGLNPEKSTIFLQSLIHEHSELQWLFATITPMGELERMTQYKEKTQKGDPAAAGLLLYPVLMAADILLYKAQAVPVGEDQVQHVELSRTIAERFNKKYGETFPLPQPKLLDKTFSRIKSLQDPAKKMSKSDDNQKASIGLLDDPDTIRLKMKSAVTDSGTDIMFDPDKKPAIANLLTIASGFSEKPIKQLEEEFQGMSYAGFKGAVAEMIISKLTPVQANYKKLVADQSYLKQLLTEHSQKAKIIAAQTLKEVKQKMGLGIL